jgi:DNA-directed RNA polymerase subunit RPC12/RpoP
LKECPECGNKLFVKKITEVRDIGSGGGIYTCTACKAQFIVEEKGVGLFDEDAQPKRIN